jgi:hypothetical protein
MGVLLRCPWGSVRRLRICQEDGLTSATGLINKDFNHVLLDILFCCVGLWSCMAVCALLLFVLLLLLYVTKESITYELV